MSAKWRRVQAWDREHLTGVLTPVRWVLHALSSITLAAILLLGVALYAVLASVPVGLLALIPTWAVKILLLAGMSIVPGAVAYWAIGRLAGGMARGPRFVVRFAALVGLTALGAFVFVSQVWPAMRYEPATGEGFRLFVDFVEKYGGTTVRRLPMFEMTELEFYAWWPMRAMLMLFTLNLIIATIRRIEFVFVNLGVLTVHTGIVLIAAGSVYYQMFKLEGDTLLMAGGAMQGQMGTGPGPAQAAFYDREDPALWIHAGMGWEQRRMTGLPRYNDYNLSAGGGDTVQDLVAPAPAPKPEEQTLAIGLSGGSLAGTEGLDFRVVGFASYAEPAERWQRVEPARAEGVRRALRLVYLVAHDLGGTGAADDEGQRALWFALVPGDAISGLRETPDFGIEYAIGMDAERWADLKARLAPGAPYGLVVEVPGAGYRGVLSPRMGESVALGDTGWSLTLQEVTPEPPFPIVTPGYEGGRSSVALVRLEPPGGEAFVRWVYHRFPAIAQDLSEGAGADGRPMRRDPDPRVRVGFVDASKLQQVYFNEDPATGLVDAVVRTPGSVSVHSGIVPGSRLREPVERFSFDLAERWEDARQIEVPTVVPEAEREGGFIGTFDKALVAVEVSEKATGWSDVVWLPFCKFTDVASLRNQTQRMVAMPDGRQISLVFGRVQHRLPGFQLRMLDFKMLSYDHRGSPRDYQTLVRVESADGRFEAYDHVTRLNAPLKAPFLWSSARGLAANIVGEIAGHLSPNQYKFAQAGWDRAGWEQSQQLVDQGLLERPRASFTILGVGNNPGIHVIALGGVLMGVGTPWAFYVKPWILRRRRDRLKAGLAREQGPRVTESKATMAEVLEGSGS